jgi:hypothetical protein
MYKGRSNRNVSCLFLWKLQKIQRSQHHHFIKQILGYKTLFFDIVTIGYALWPAMKKSVRALLVRATIIYFWYSDFKVQFLDVIWEQG